MFAALFAHTPLAYIVINLDPIALQLGNLAIRWYGLGYVLAISVALWATLRYADVLGVSRDHVWNVFLWTAIAGLIGGRLYFVIQQPDLVNDYLKNPINIIAVWNGGMAFFGAIFLAAPTAAFLAWRAGLSPWLTFDMGAMFAAVGQMFGRFGNMVNGDIVGYPVGHPLIPGNVCPQSPCIGFVSDPHVMPWATAYLNPGSFIAEHGVPYQPAAAYEVIINLIALAILYPLRLILPRRVGTGTFFCLYVAFYSIGQFIVFFARSNVFVTFLHIDTLKQAQWTAIFTFIAIALIYWFFIRRVGKLWTFDRTHPAPPPIRHAPALATQLGTLHTPDASVHPSDTHASTVPPLPRATRARPTRTRDDAPPSD
jgi:phosphatidylglycerol:prolipoprotein diacylglycerol transferase